MQKGFTLIELLGVIILISLLMILVFPSIINSIKKTSNSTDEMTLELIYNASDIYVKNHINDFPKVEGNKYVITLRELVDEDLLTSNIKLSNSNDNLIDKKCIEVTYDENYKYELKDECEEYLTNNQ